MTPNNQSPLTPFPLELKEDQLFNLNQASASSPASCQIIFEPVQQEGGFYNMESHTLQHPDEAEILFSQVGSSYHPGAAVMDESGLGLGLIKRNENQSEDRSVKWTSSDMRLKKMMMNYDAANNSCIHKLEDHQKQPSSSSSSLETENIRVCADCNTTKTPLWRSGPRGPKSLCNACGIRQRKARRAMAAAAANATGVQLAAGATSNKKSNKTLHKDKASSNIINSCLPLKKRSKFTCNSPSRGKNKLLYEDLTIILSKNSSALQRVFPQDEKEAAILLMALSHGLVHG